MHIAARAKVVATGPRLFARGKETLGATTQTDSRCQLAVLGRRHDPQLLLVLSLRLMALNSLFHLPTQTARRPAGLRCAYV